METTPIEVLEHHVEMLENELRRSDPNNYLFRSVIKSEISIFQKAIIELKNIELK